MSGEQNGAALCLLHSAVCSVIVLNMKLRAGGITQRETTANNNFQPTQESLFTINIEVSGFKQNFYLYFNLFRMHMYWQYIAVKLIDISWLVC